MFCSKCGNQLSDGARFCGKCGTPVAAPTVAPSAVAPAVQRLYMDAKGLTVFNYKFEIRDENGNLRYRAATVSEGMVTWNARIYNLDDSEAMAIHQQKKLTMAAMNFDIVEPNGALATQAIQKVKFTRFTYELPELGITVDGDFFALRFEFFRNGQLIGKINKKLMSWGDSYELEFTDPALDRVLLSVIMVVQMAIIARRRR